MLVKVKVHGKLVMELRKEMASSLVNLRGASIETGVVPQDFRDAIAVSLHKKWSRDKSRKIEMDSIYPENYRPISLTSTTGKIFESVIKDNIVRFLDENNLIWDSQRGFRSGPSCLTNLLDFMEEVTR